MDMEGNGEVKTILEFEPGQQEERGFHFLSQGKALGGTKIEAAPRV